MTEETKKMTDEEIDETETIETETEVEEKETKEQPETKAKSFTQEEVSKMMAKEKRQGKASVYRELGIDPKDTKSIGMLKAFIESQKAGKSEETTQDNSEILEANKRAFKAEIKAEAMIAGAKPEFIEDIVILVLSKLENTEDGEETDFKSVLTELKTKYDIWFKKASDEEDAGKNGTGSSFSSEKKKKKDEPNIGSRLAAKRKNSNTKSNFFNN